MRRFSHVLLFGLLFLLASVGCKKKQAVTPPDDGKTTIIPLDEAIHLLNNYDTINPKGPSGVLISVEDLGGLVKAIKEQGGNGARFYFAANKKTDSNYNGLVIVSTQDGKDIIFESKTDVQKGAVFPAAQGAQREVYYRETEHRHTGICPPDCDKSSPLEKSNR